jgi:hypothetical protein
VLKFFSYSGLFTNLVWHFWHSAFLISFLQVLKPVHLWRTFRNFS